MEYLNKIVAFYKKELIYFNVDRSLKNPKMVYRETTLMIKILIFYIYYNQRIFIESKIVISSLLRKIF